MDIAGFINEIKKRKDLKDVVHHEVVEAAAAAYGKTSTRLAPAIEDALSRGGVLGLYSHQATGIDLVTAGADVVIMTPTSSGKSLIYNVPVLGSVLADSNSKALYIFPLKGLEQDQMRSLEDFSAGLRASAPADSKTTRRSAAQPSVCEIYDGDTSDYRRKKIRESPPPVLVTNPDMLHMGIIPFHAKWESFFKNLKYVVIDEVHTYRGVFGSHVSHVLRRLARTARMYGSNPQFIASSATIENPQELCRMLTGKKFDLVWKNGAPSGVRHFIFINPARGASPYTLATKLFIAAVASGGKTIAFTKARRVTELMHSWVRSMAPNIAPKISSYRAGFLPSERRAIEARLFSGELSGVISTSALELGVDVGGLDVCILVGYPGTISSTWQRAGRVGRSGRDALIVMVGLADALDQHFMRNPVDFFTRAPEAAVLDPENPAVVSKHLRCAAAESPLRSNDDFYAPRTYASALKELEAAGKLRHWVKGGVWYGREKYPHQGVSLREAGETYRIITTDGSAIGESSSARVLKDLHPGAVYLHRGAQFRVVTLDVANRVATCRRADDLDFYTRSVSHEESEVVSTSDRRKLPGVELNLGVLRITERVTGYRKKKLFTDEGAGEFELPGLPESVFTTSGIWMTVSADTLERIKKRGFSPAGSLHAVEHAAIATLPLFALCDRMDLGGVSYEFNPEMKSPAIFIYDGHEGGAGLVKRGFECAEDWFDSARRIMRECECEVACPSCTQDPKCGNGNEPLDRRGAVLIIDEWLGGR